MSLVCNKWYLFQVQTTVKQTVMKEAKETSKTTITKKKQTGHEKQSRYKAEKRCDFRSQSVS